jgi:hypothetical protein
MNTPSLWRAHSHENNAERTDTVDLDLDDVSVDDRPDALGRPGQ